MTETTRATTAPRRGRTYQITVAGNLDDDWCDYLNGLKIEVSSCPSGSAITTLTCRVADQAALRGLLVLLWDLNLTLLAVNGIDTAGEDLHTADICSGNDPRRQV